MKRENKRKGQTPYEPYIYIVIHTKGSQITAKRIKDERTICRDASKFKPLRTVKIQQEEPDIPTRPAVPNCIAEDKTQEEPTPAQMNATADTQQVNDPTPLRRSERSKKSTFDGKLKDYGK